MSRIDPNFKDAPDGCIECDAPDGRHTDECVRNQEEDALIARASTDARGRALMDAIARLERAIATRPYHTDYGKAKQDGLRDAVAELKSMILDDRYPLRGTVPPGTSSLGRVTFEPHTERGIAGAKALVSTYRSKP